MHKEHLTKEFGFDQTEVGSKKEIVGKPYYFSFADSLAALEKTVPLQREAFDLTEEATCPGHMLVTLKKIGGTVISVDDEQGQTVSFSYIWPTTTPGTFLLDMIGVKEELRDKGIGLESMKFLHLEAEKLGIREILFTYDPLKVRNANIYLRKMAAQVQKYEIDPYGDNGLGGDRFLASWDITSEKVTQSLSGNRPKYELEKLAQLPAIGRGVYPDAPEILLPAPADETKLSAEEMNEYRSLYREVGTQYFPDYSIGNFVSEIIGGERVNSYILSRKRE